MYANCCLSQSTYSIQVFKSRPQGWSIICSNFCCPASYTFFFEVIHNYVSDLSLQVPHSTTALHFRLLNAYTWIFHSPGRLPWTRSVFYRWYPARKRGIWPFIQNCQMSDSPARVRAHTELQYLESVYVARVLMFWSFCSWTGHLSRK